MLSIANKVEHFNFEGAKGFKHIWKQLKLAFWLFRKAKKRDLILIWFSDFHGVLPSLLKRLYRFRIITILGGYDVMKFPTLNYGALNSPIRKKAVKFVVSSSDFILPVSEYTLCHAKANLNIQLPDSRIFPNCVAAEEISKNKEKKYDYVTVCLGQDLRTGLVKGIDIYLELASNMPDKSFLVIGVDGELKQMVDAYGLSNLRVLPQLTHTDLLDVLSACIFICQFSRVESFGVAFLEGIFSGCIGITFDDIGPSEIVQKLGGIIVKRTELYKLWSEEIKVFEPSTDRSYFSFEKRTQRIQQVIAHVYKD